METLTEEEWTHVLKDLTLYKKLDENVSDPSTIMTECTSLKITLKSITSDLCDKITKNSRYIKDLTSVRHSNDAECLNYKYWVYYQIWQFHKSNDKKKLDDVIGDFLNIQNAVHKASAIKICQFDFISKNKEELEEKLEKKNLRDYIKNYENIKKDVTDNVNSDIYFKYLTYISKIFDIHKKKCEKFWDFFSKGCKEYFELSTDRFKHRDLLDILQKRKAQAQVTKPEGPAVNGHAQISGEPPGSVARPVENLKDPKVVEGDAAKLKSPKVDGRTGQDNSKGEGAGKDTHKTLAGQNQESGQQLSRVAATVAGGKQEDHKAPAQKGRSTSLWPGAFNILSSVFSGPKGAGSSAGKEQKLAGAPETQGKGKPLAIPGPSAKSAVAAKVEPKPAHLLPKPVESPPTPAKSSPQPDKSAAAPSKAAPAQDKEAPASSYVASVLAPKVLTPEDNVEIPEAKVMCPNGTISDSSTCVSASGETESAQSLEVSYPGISSETNSLVEPLNSHPIMEEENYNIFTSNPERTIFTGAIILGVIYVFYFYYNVNTIFICKYGKYMLLYRYMYVLFKCITTKKNFINMFRVSFPYQATPLGRRARNKVRRRRDSDYDDRSVRSYSTLDNNSEYDDMNSSTMSFNVAYYPT